MPLSSFNLAPGVVTSSTNSFDCANSSCIARFCRHITTKAVSSTTAAIAPNEPKELQIFRGVDLNGNTSAGKRSFRASLRMRSRTAGDGSTGSAVTARVAAVACQSSSSFWHSAQFSRCSFNACASAASSADSARAGIISLYSSWTIRLLKSKTLSLAGQQFAQSDHTGAHASLYCAQWRAQTLCDFRLSEALEIGKHYRALLLVGEFGERVANESALF